MTFVTISNFVVMALCIVVIVQSLRMAKSIAEIRASSLKEGVAQLDAATIRAQAVLTELKTVLSAASASQNRALANGESLREELSVVIGIGNAVAERIVEAAAAQNEKAAAAQNEKKADVPAQKPHLSRSSGRSRSRGRSGSKRSEAEVVVSSADAASAVSA